MGLIQIMDTNTVLVSGSTTWTDWYLHVNCSDIHWKVITKIFARASNFFSTFWHTVWFAIMFERSSVKHEHPTLNLEFPKPISKLFFLFFYFFWIFTVYISHALMLTKFCCNLSGGVALIVWFTTNGMCVKNNTIIYVAQASNSKRDCDVVALPILMCEHLNVTTSVRKERLWHMISIVACCHGAKLCAHAAQDFRSQQFYIWIL